MSSPKTCIEHCHQNSWPWCGLKSLQSYGSIAKFLVLSVIQPENTVKLIHNKMQHCMFQQLGLSTRCRTESQTAWTTVLHCCCKLRETNCPESNQTRGKGNGLDMFAVQVYTKCCVIASVHNLLMHFQGARSPRHAANWHKIKFGSDMVSWRKTSDLREVQNSRAAPAYPQTSCGQSRPLWESSSHYCQLHTDL